MPKIHVWEAGDEITAQIAACANNQRTQSIGNPRWPDNGL